MSSQEILGGILSDLVIDANMPDNLITDTIAPILQRQLETNLQGNTSTSTSLSDTTINWIRRRRMTKPGIFDLPDIAFVRISSYLCTPSRALLALSLTTRSKSWRKYKWNNKKVSPILAWANVKRYEPSDQTKVIVASQNWESLDFGELNNEGEKGICSRLNDDDIAGILACINARDNLKTLQIAGCINITGRGLQLLSGSAVLRGIDLTQDITSNGKEDASYSEKLSEDVVLPILDSIINTPGKSLTLVRFPSRWRLESSPDFQSFLVDYNRLLESRQVSCSKCTVGLWGTYLERGVNYPNAWVNFGDYEDKWYGFQNYTCIKCTKFFCYECDNGVDGNSMLQTCKECNEEYCYECGPMKNCRDCSDPVCNDCSVKCPYSSSGCEYVACSNCSDTSFMVCDTCGDKGCGEWCTGPSFSVCDGDNCNKVQCENCFDEPGCVESCDSCNSSFCADRRYSKLSEDWGSACEDCIKLIAGELGQKILKDKQTQDAKYLSLQREFDAFKLSQQQRTRNPFTHGNGNSNGRNSLSVFYHGHGQK